MSHIITSILLIMFLASCASTTANHYTQTVESWRGGDTRDLTARWGIPDQKLVGANGSSVYVYKTKSYMPPPSRIGSKIDVILGSGDKPIIVAMPNINKTWSRGGASFSCIAAFKADKSGKIIGTQTHGSGCYGSDNFAKIMGNPNIVRS